jgi:hypothetical protein
VDHAGPRRLRVLRSHRVIIVVCDEEHESTLLFPVPAARSRTRSPGRGRPPSRPVASADPGRATARRWSGCSGRRPGRPPRPRRAAAGPGWLWPSMTSAAPVGRTMSASRLSIDPFHTARASSYPIAPGEMASPLKPFPQLGGRAQVHLLGYTRSSSERACSSGGCYDRSRAIDWATMAASSPTPNSTEDLRLRRKWTPQKNRPGTTMLAPSSVSGKPMASKAGNRIQCA